MANTPPIVLFTYDISVFGRKMDWYFALTGIKYHRCLTLNRMPRPMLHALGVAYRRIPVLAIGRDIYCDTRLILDKLEQLFPETSIGPKDSFQKGVQTILENYVIDAGPFGRTAGLIPPTAPVMSDPEWVQDRFEMSGRVFNTETILKGRPESLAHARQYFYYMEHEFLADGRDYLLGTKEPTLTDIHAVWVFDWILQMAQFMFDYLEKDIINAQIYPKTFAWVDRFRGAIVKAQEKNGIADIWSAEHTVETLLKSDFFEPDGVMDPLEPLKLKKGQDVEIYPIDSGFTRHDKGKLVSIGLKEVVIERKPNEGDGLVRIHFPRNNFRIEAVGEPKL